ncbi:RsmF rRNA methyltransferase first C-terminal domain-containing protein [Ferviditalea candida]|uniref:RsmB/NOP family class I SAM-dependent RNA methyltransferase n=1 Tax=Ferviditalea candida TaxID=3108399 RepID=A0ABU5ZCI4_9BACL|nr:RsmB/NOP family class I SAM-dependent RNA methyltransferase [Paenibacillaceae bacterium T2]
MTVKLPEAFEKRMQHMLGEEFEPFLASYEKERYYGLRVNTLKAPVGEFLELSPFRLSPIPWCREGFYYNGEERPGKHPYYYAGLYYIQEPSAMSPVELLDVRPGDRVLDVCAAPGGKSTQIAAKLQGQGVLVSNDNSADRVKALVKNIELFGVRNAAVLNETPNALGRVFGGYFDKILIDAPCSGEGMFRKDEDMIRSWSPESVQTCVVLQKDILDAAAVLLAPGGRMVYSTCTFAPEENEARIADFLDRHPHFEVVPIPDAWGFAQGRPEWIMESRQGIEGFSGRAAEAVKGTARLWPHCIEGEGHFVAVLQHKGEGLGIEADPASGRERTSGRGNGGKKPAQTETEREDIISRFFAEMGFPDLPGKLVFFGDFAYLAAAGLPDLSGLKVARPGWYIGNIKKNRFEPSQALAMGLRAQEAVRSVSFTADSLEVVRYLKGETLQLEKDEIAVRDTGVSAKGYCLVCVDGYPLGWGKWIDGLLKNEYPPGWRWIW